jgi:hypothetical protein
MRNTTFALLLGGVLLTTAAVPAAGIDVNISIGLPVVVMEREPQLTYIPGTYVYYIPDRSDNFFFYQGYWWRPYRDDWYRSGHYNGPWIVVERRRVPRTVLQLPIGWRSQPPGHARFQWAEVNHGWKQWEKEKRWDNARDQRQGAARPGNSHGKRK